MERVSGSKAGEYFPDLAAPTEHRRALGRQLATALAHLHAVPLDDLGETSLDVDAEVTEATMTAAVEGMAARIAELSGPPIAAVPLARQWLLDHLDDVVPAGRLVPPSGRRRPAQHARRRRPHHRTGRLGGGDRRAAGPRAGGRLAGRHRTDGLAGVRRRLLSRRAVRQRPPTTAPSPTTGSSSPSARACPAGRVATSSAPAPSVTSSPPTRASTPTSGPSATWSGPWRTHGPWADDSDGRSGCPDRGCARPDGRSGRPSMSEVLRYVVIER